ncbi:CCT domain-containing protein [Cynara cardunculus var. scolymus]|uniref:CCT domain-containing protein n=1 Tax=Cynara cardunculus var. scolymus TaxID=59895 RepID=A0A124SFW9_CYNCS|nr:CCT domain-containing protein [Cynara cardunculus var. scolymus]
MGEVLINSDGGEGIADMPELMMRSEDRTNDGGGGGDSPTTTTNNVVRWEKFLPKMVLRVLLVEADDSTRQIITALLRKCSYKVAAVSDGLKAWEVLKGRSHNIDLILTEVELPSISGFALLTLIMEHPVCKNIPVIMMSAHDSVSTVYKCMLRGAADFLVKPVRKNELKNLWQHVWRRQASTAGGNGHPEESDAQQKVEATAENNATSNRSSGSCTKPDMEADGPPVEQLKELTDLKWANQSGTQNNEAEGSAKDDTQKMVNTCSQEKNMAIDVRWENVVDANVAIGNTSREAIDLIGSFDSYPKPSYKSSLNCGANKIDHPSPILDLSLRRSHPSSSVNQFSDDRHRLKQSDVSAFSRYINRTQPPLTSGSTSISNQQKDCEINSDKPPSKNVVEHNYDTHSAPVGNSRHHMMSQHGQVESQRQFPSPKDRVFPVPVPARGLRSENPGATYGSVLPPPFSVQPSLNQMRSPCSSEHQEPSLFQAPELHCVMADRKATDQMETVEDRGIISSATDHSLSSSFCNGGTLNRLNSIGSGSNGSGNTQRSSHREAALNKFRMKRKDRCYDKKVRYESRKKLAEQRPRVKGQFVRQGQTSNLSPMEVDTE